jgi:hypothetical protein
LLLTGKPTLLSIFLGLLTYTASSSVLPLLQPLKELFMTKAFDIFNQFATDPAKELEGVWIPLGPATRNLESGEPDPASVPRILVARSGNKKHGKLVSKLYEAAKSILEMKNDAADAKGEEITIDSMAKAIYLGWENLSFKGVAVANSADMTAEDRLAEAKRHLAVREYRKLVMGYSENFEKYKVVQDEEDAGN